MKRTLPLLVVSFFLFSTVFAAASFGQMPGMPRPRPTPRQSGGAMADPERPQATDVPVLLRSTLEIRADLSNKYWKLPNESNYTSWIPEVRFKVFYKGATRLRYKAEYFLPDGKPWFDEMLEQGMIDNGKQTVELNPSRAADKFTNRATDAVGTYGIKISDTRDDSVLFQGKFKVNKFKYGPAIPMFKNQYCFYVEQDWNIPIGYVWLDWDTAAAYPTVSVWIKGDNRPGDIEGRLFYKGEQIATTDNRGRVLNNESRRPNVPENKDLTHFQRWDLSWYGIVYGPSQEARNRHREAKFINDMDGDYTVKIFLKGQQIREVNFSVAGGKLADNGIAKNNKLGDHMIIVPVKVLSTAEKWNANSWKTDAFYGNPLTGFSL